nr:hypothetical protein [Tanacetum cinerariifolium]
MAWLPKCEELERAVAGRNWLDMMIVYFDEYAYEQREFTRRLNGLIGEMNEACADRMDFVQELQSVVGESVAAKTAVFLEHMMNKEGSRECQLADLVTEGGDKGAIVKACGYFVGMCILEGDSLPICDELRRSVDSTYAMAALPICDELRRSVDSTDWEPQFIYYCERSKLDDIRLARQINALCDTLTCVIDERRAFIEELELLAYKAREKDLFIAKLKGNMGY